MAYFYGIGAAVAGLQALAEKGVPDGYASLDLLGYVPDLQLPPEPINVKRYGATGNGTTDDSAAIQAAIAAAGSGNAVFLPSGTYAVATSISLRDGVSLIGAGIEATTIKGIAGLATAVLLGTSGNTVSDVTIRDLTIDGNRTAFATNVKGVQVTAGARITIEKVRFEDVRDIAIYLFGTPDATIELCHLYQCGKGGLSGHNINLESGCDRAKILYNTIIKNGEVGDTGFGIRLDTNCNDALIEGNYIEQATVVSTVQGDRILEPIGWNSNCLRTKAINNTCLRGGDNGISVSGPESIVEGNRVDSSCQSGIAMLSTAVNSVINNNIVKNTSQNASIAQAGISMGTGATDVVVTGNRCFDDQGTKTQAYGIASSGTADFNTVVGNNCRGNLTGGVNLVGANNVNASNMA